MVGDERVKILPPPPRRSQQRSQPAVYQLHLVQDLSFLNTLTVITRHHTVPEPYQLCLVKESLPDIKKQLQKLLNSTTVLNAMILIRFFE